MRKRSAVMAFWFLVLGLVAARVTLHDRIVPGTTHERGAIAMTATRPG